MAGLVQTLGSDGVMRWPIDQKEIDEGRKSDGVRDNKVNEAIEDDSYRTRFKSCLKETYEKLQKKLGEYPSQENVVEALPPPFSMSRSTLQRKLKLYRIQWPPNR